MAELSELSDARVLAAWDRIARRAALHVQRSGSREGFVVGPGSQLAGDDSISTSYTVGYAARQSLLGAIDHLHALCALRLDAHVVHLSALSTLARGSLECAAVALWVLSPLDQRERVSRALRWHLKDIQDGDTAAVDLGVPVPTPRQERVAKVERVATTQGLDWNEIKKGYRSTDAVRVADSRCALEILFAWRLCSGFAHGRSWPMLGGLVRLETEPTSDPDVSMVKMTADSQRSLYPVLAAAQATQEAVDLFTRSAASP
jgi:hypothetical protein